MIFSKQQKKLEKLIDGRDCFIIEHSTHSGDVENKKKSKHKTKYVPPVNNRKPVKQPDPLRNNNNNKVMADENMKRTHKPQNKNSVMQTNSTKNGPKNEETPGSTKMNYSKAVTMGKPKHKLMKQQSKHQDLQKDHDNNNISTTPRMNTLIQQLIDCLKNQRKTDGSSESQAGGNGNRGKRFRRK